MRLQDLTDVHTRRNAERVQHDIDRRAVRQERHVLLAHDARDDTLVPVTAGHLVADRDLALLRDIDAHEAVDAGRQFVVVLAGKDLHVDDLARLTVRHAQRGIAHLARLLAEDRAQQALLCRQLRLALGRDLADEDIAGAHVRADGDNAVLVEILERFLRHIRDVARDLLGTELRVARIALILLDVDRGVEIALDEILAEEDGVLVVVAFPRHIGDNNIVAEGELAVVRRGTVGDGLPLRHAVTRVDERLLVDAGRLVRADEFLQFIGIKCALVRADGDRICRNVRDLAAVLCEHHDA